MPDVRVLGNVAPFVLLFEDAGFPVPDTCYCISRLVYSKVLFFVVVNNTDLLIFLNLPQNIYAILLLTFKQNSAGPPLLRWHPVTEIFVGACFFGETADVNGFGVGILRLILATSTSRTMVLQQETASLFVYRTWGILLLPTCIDYTALDGYCLLADWQQLVFSFLRFDPPTWSYG